MTDTADAQQTGEILVVDDNEDNLDILARRLSRRGYEVTQANNGEAALARVTASPDRYHLVLLDVMMPGIDGFEVTGRLREEFSPTELPIILVTAKSQSGDVITGLRAGANDYVTKPIDYPVLFARVKNHVDLSNSHRAFRNAQKLLIDAAKMETIGYLAAGVAHEIRNPLAQLQMGVDYLKSVTEPEGDSATILETMEEAVGSADKIVVDLMQFADGRKLRRERTDISSLAETCIQLLGDEIGSKAINTRLDFAENCQADIDVAQIETAIINVLTNAIQAMPNGGDITVRTELRAANNKEIVADEGVRSGNRIRQGDEIAVLEIRDTGPGIPDENLSTVFDAFFTSQATGKGTGLGLTVAKKIVDIHGGLLRIRTGSRPTGAVVTFLLPSKPDLETSV